MFGAAPAQRFFLWCVRRRRAAPASGDATRNVQPGGVASVSPSAAVAPPLNERRGSGRREGPTLALASDPAGKLSSSAAPGGATSWSATSTAAADGAVQLRPGEASAATAGSTQCSSAARAPPRSERVSLGLRTTVARQRVRASQGDRGKLLAKYVITSREFDIRSATGISRPQMLKFARLDRTARRGLLASRRHLVRRVDGRRKIRS